MLIPYLAFEWRWGHQSNFFPLDVLLFWRYFYCYSYFIFTHFPQLSSFLFLIRLRFSLHCHDANSPTIMDLSCGFHILHSTFFFSWKHQQPRDTIGHGGIVNCIMSCDCYHKFVFSRQSCHAVVAAGVADLGINDFSDIKILLENRIARDRMSVCKFREVLSIIFG